MKAIKSSVAVLMALIMLLIPQGICLAADSWTPNLICDGFEISEKSIEAGDSFRLSFSLKNTSSRLDIRNVLIRLSGGEAFSISNSTDTLYKDNIKSSSTADFAKEFYCNEGTSGGMYPITVSVAYEYNKNGEAASESREFSVNVKVNEKKQQAADKKPAALTPQVLVTDFSYGDIDITGGIQFNLSFKIKNNSNSIDIQNVIIKLSGGEAFVVADGTDTSSVNKISAGSVSAVSKAFKCLNSAVSGVYPITASISYEYFDGDEKAQGSADLTMSIPVVQKDRLSFEGIALADQNVIVEQETDCAFKIINSGQTRLANGVVSVLDENGKMLASAFIGNIEPGTQFESNYTLPITIEETGAKTLTIVFEYDNENQEKKTITQNFNIVAEEYNDPFEVFDRETEPQPESSVNLPVVIGGVVGGIVLIIVLAVAVPKIIKKRKAKKGSEAFDEEI